MAFHVACPISCRRICYCSLGFAPSLHSAKAKNGFLMEVLKLEEFLNDPCGIKSRGVKEATVQVAVPKVLPPPPPLLPAGVVGEGFGGPNGADDAAAMVSAQTKRVALQRQAAEAMVAAEDYARRFENGDLVDASGVPAGEKQGSSSVKVMCRICFFGENEDSDRARRMLSCKSCAKKYHRSCLKTWAQHRDIFHWSSWTCPSCRICEICRRTGDPNKFMFCKRCDGAYHCYCMHPPHKNVSSGPYLCPKHTKCHSCGSNVPGNGQSLRWFLGYTCCDACGRLFVKGNYCPVCLKVYRDSESTPMVCCDVCQRWVHCHCDGISDEKYLQYQVDGNLQYKCAACRGECYQVKDLEDAVQELWRRRDESDRELIARLRAAAGFPSQEEIFCISPSSDDEESGPQLLKNEFGRSLKFSFKGLVEKSPKKTKEYGKETLKKKKSKKKGLLKSLIAEEEPNPSLGLLEAGQHLEYGLGDENENERQSHKTEESDMYSSAARSLSHTEGVCSINQPEVRKQKFIDEVMVSDEDRKLKVRIKSNKRLGMDSEEDAGKEIVKSKSVKGKKLVINLGLRKINVTNSPRSDASSRQREQDLMNSNGDKISNLKQSKGSKVEEELERDQRSSGKVRSKVADTIPKLGNGNSAGGNETMPPKDILVFSRKRSSDGSKTVLGSVGGVPMSRSNEISSGKLSGSKHQIDREVDEDHNQTTVPDSLPRDSRPLLKFKFKKPVLQNQSSPHLEDEKICIKGQRSKRKRSSLFIEKISFDENDANRHLESLSDEIMEANWILKKLGRDAIGKRVEVHHPSDNSWHKGVVTNVIDGATALSVTLDDGKVKTLELGKQGVRFVPQKQKRLKS